MGVGKNSFKCFPQQVVLHFSDATSPEKPILKSRRYCGRSAVWPFQCCWRAPYRPQIGAHILTQDNAYQELLCAPRSRPDHIMPQMALSRDVQRL